jgi:plasmid stability protein
MPVTLTIKNVPDALAAKLRERAERNHRPLQTELIAMLERATSYPKVGHASSGCLMDRLVALAGDRGIDTTKRLTREQAHDRKLMRKTNSAMTRRSPS